LELFVFPLIYLELFLELLEKLHGKISIISIIVFLQFLSRLGTTLQSINTIINFIKMRSIVSIFLEIFIKCGQFELAIPGFESGLRFNCDKAFFGQ
jgi:hypothetical protein